MTENTDVMELYRKNYKEITDEIVSAIKEGFEEGVKEGVETGFLDGLAECFGKGFLKISKTEEKSLEKILEDVSVDTIKNEVERTIKKEICPILNDRMDNLCNEVLIKIKENKITVRSEITDQIKEFNTGGLAKRMIDDALQEVKKYLPKNFISSALYDGFQKGISECLAENINKCDKQIKDAIARDTSN